MTSIVTSPVNPPFFIGPFAPNFRFTDALVSQMSTNSLAYTLLNPTGTPFFPIVLTIDVRDVARATVHALTSPPTSEVGRKRLLLVPQVASWKDVAEYIAEKRPELKDRVSVAIRTDSVPAPPKGPVDNTRAIEVLKLGSVNDWHTTFLDAVDSIIEAEKNFAKQGKTFH